MRLATLLALALGSIATLSSGQALAASTVTDAFLANVAPNLSFLEQSSKLALDRSTSAPVRRYAQGGMAEATTVADALGRTTVADAGAVVTGRSVAAGARADGVQSDGLGQAANGRAPLGRADLDGLAKLSGRKFLDAYWLKQLDALSQLRADYRSYALRGDDPALVAMAQRELRAVENRLALLTKI